jgi:hypothetical protein
MNTQLTDKEFLALARSFDAGPEPMINGYLWTEMGQFADGDHHNMMVEYRGNGKWAIKVGGCTLDIHGERQYEGMSSSRTDEYLAENRYVSAREALEIAGHYRDRVTWAILEARKTDPKSTHWGDSDDHVIFRATALAYVAHRGQVRKYSEPGQEPSPYINHPAAIASVTESWTIAKKKSEQRRLMVSAAWLHDVIEDCPAEFAGRIKELGQDIYTLVKELTNPSKGSKLNRAARKKMDRDHLKHVSWQAKVIKLIDRRSNLMEIHGQPAEPDFKRLYARESLELLEALRSPDTADLEEELEVWARALLETKG